MQVQGAVPGQVFGEIAREAGGEHPLVDQLLQARAGQEGRGHLQQWTVEHGAGLGQPSIDLSQELLVA